MGRFIRLRLPVHDLAIWQKAEVANALKNALEFLTGDIWQIEFIQRKMNAVAPQQGLLPLEDKVAVIPFSEELNSRAVAGLMTKEFGAGLVRVRLGKKSFDKQRDANGKAMPFTTVPTLSRLEILVSRDERSIKGIQVRGIVRDRGLSSQRSPRHCSRKRPRGVRAKPRDRGSVV